MGLVERSFRNGEVIIKEGDIGKSFFRLLEGKAGVYADYGKSEPFKIGVLEAGEYFGEMAIIETYPRSATVVAVGNVKVVEIPEDDLNTYFRANPDQIIELMKHLGKRVRAMTNDYNEAQALLKKVKESEESKKNKSLFTKIKRTISIYQNNKNRVTEPSAESLREELAAVKDEGSGKIEAYKKGTIIFREGEFGKCIYILHGGKVGVYDKYGQDNEVKLTELMAVSFFGEMGMLDDEPRSATVVSESDETYAELVYAEDLETMFRLCPVKVDMILRHLSFRLRSLTQELLFTCKEITEICGTD